MVENWDGEMLLASRPAPNLEYHPLSAVCDCQFNIFAANLQNWKLFLHPQPEDGPCCGDRDLPYEGNSGLRSVTKGMKTGVNYWCPARGGATAVAAPGTVSPSAGSCMNKEQTPVPPKGREARTFYCTTEPWLRSQQCHTDGEICRTCDSLPRIIAANAQDTEEGSSYIKIQAETDFKAFKNCIMCTEFEN